MASSSGRKSGSSDRSTTRRRVVIGAGETVRVRYSKDKPQVEAERTKTSRNSAKVASRRAGIGPAPSGAGRRIATARRDDRERRRRGIRLRRQAAALTLVAIVVGVVWGAVSFTRSDVFRVQTVNVRGTSHLTPDGVRAIAAIRSDTTMFTLDNNGVVSRLRAEPWVAEVTLDRDFPHTLNILIRERTPSAVVDAGGAQLLLISADGYWLGKRSTQETESFVSIRDVEKVDSRPGRRSASKEILNALRILRGLSPELLARVKVISAPTVEKTALLTTDDIEIFFGSSVDLAKKDRIVREILAKEAGKVVYINVRAVDRPIWRGLETGQ